jgi:hypothetical protein
VLDAQSLRAADQIGAEKVQGWSRYRWHLA